MVKLWQQWLVRGAIALTTTSLLIILAIKARLIVSAHQSPDPEAILVLGGGNTRELAAAQLATQNPTLAVWVSSGLDPTQAHKIFSAQNVALTRINLDYSATDTVTNFTTLVAQLQAHNIRHIYLVTSDFHMPRSKAIAFWVLGSRGIAYTPISVPSNTPSEPQHKIVRDIARSWLWLVTGRTGSSLDPDPPSRPSKKSQPNA
ncbi:YdcF family protein [Leptothoe sp. ISB3NOV94-8A]